MILGKDLFKKSPFYKNIVFLREEKKEEINNEVHKQNINKNIINNNLLSMNYNNIKK